MRGLCCIISIAVHLSSPLHVYSFSLLPISSKTRTKDVFGRSTLAQQQRPPDQQFYTPPLPLEISLTDGSVVSLELTDDETCISTIVAKIGQQAMDGPESLASSLTSYWQQHVQMFQEFYQPQVYDGPPAYNDSASDDDDHKSSSPSSVYESSIQCRVELASGLVLEVGRSTIPNAGLGLFIRKQSKTTSGILQSIGSAFAGYSRGYVRTNLLGCSDYQTSRAFQFRLEEGLQSTVWFGSKLLTIEEALNQSGATSVAGHHLFFNDDHDGFEADESGKSMASSGGGGNPSKTKVWRKTVGIVPDDDECFFFVPDDISMINGVGGEDSSAIVSPNTASIQTIGHFVNDLAGGDRAKSSEEYDAISSLRNILVLLSMVARRRRKMITANYGVTSTRYVLKWLACLY